MTKFTNLLKLEELEKELQDNQWALERVIAREEDNTEVINALNRQIEKLQAEVNEIKKANGFDVKTLSNAEIIQAFEDEGVETTDELSEAIYIMDDGTLISGMFFDGMRTEDHRIIEILFDDIDRYSEDFWQQAHERTGMIQHVPETSFILIKQGQKVTEAQAKYFDQVDEVEKF